jgi:hypothetical protein
MYRVLTKIEVETPKGAVTLKHGQIIKLSKDEAIPLIEAEMIIPVEKVAYKVYSEILQAYLWVAHDLDDRNTLRSNGMTEAIYTADEIKKLKGTDRGLLRQIHECKEAFSMSNIVEHKKLKHQEG